LVKLMSETAPTTFRRTISSLSVRNFRLYFLGQTVSLSGTWMQGVAQAWLVLKLTGSGTALGLVIALQFLPLLLFGPFGGVITDRFDKRRLLYVTQAAAASLALTLGILVSTDLIRLWMVYALAAGLGCVHAVDNPTRQTFVLEMVGAEELPNAVTLNSVIVNLARVVGPAIAGVLIGTVGLGPCFLINAASYLAVVVALARMQVHELQRATPQPRTGGQLREGLRYVRSTPTLMAPLLMMAVIGTLAYEFQVILPLMAKFTFQGDAGTYGLMTSSMGGGAVIGGLYAASRPPRAPATLSLLALVFGALLVAASLAPTLPLELAALVLVGAVSITFIASGNTTIQLAARPEMRGRVMALWSVALLGSTPVGGPIVGWVGQHFGPRFGLGLGAAAALLAGALAYPVLARIDSDARPPSPTDSTGGCQPGAGQPDPEAMLEESSPGAATAAGHRP
jgi:MFS family permease